MSLAYNKQKGSQWEVDLVSWFRGRGLDVEQMHLRGREDEGDLILKLGGLPFTIEAKNEKGFNLAGWVKEAEIEAVNYGKHRSIARPHFVVIHKRRSHPVHNAYVTTPLSEWLDQVDQTPF